MEFNRKCQVERTWRELIICKSTGWSLTRWTGTLQEKALSILVDNKFNISYNVMFLVFY